MRKTDIEIRDVKEEGKSISVCVSERDRERK